MSEAYDFGFNNDNTFNDDSNLQVMTISTISSELYRFGEQKKELNKQVQPLLEKYTDFLSKGLVPEDMQIDLDSLESGTQIETVKDVVDNLTSLYSFDNLSNDIEELTEELKTLNKVQNIAYLFQGARLIQVQKQEKKIIGLYGSFENFCKEVIGISKRAAYDCIDIVKYFVECARAHSDLVTIADNKSKIRAYIPILKNESIDDNIKDNLRAEILSKLEVSTYREMEIDAKQKKSTLNIGKISNINADDELEKRIREVIYEIRKGMKDGKKPIITWQ